MQTRSLGCKYMYTKRAFGIFWSQRMCLVATMSFSSPPGED